MTIFSVNSLDIFIIVALTSLSVDSSIRIFSELVSVDCFLSLRTFSFLHMSSNFQLHSVHCDDILNRFVICCFLQRLFVIIGTVLLFRLNTLFYLLWRACWKLFSPLFDFCFQAHWSLFYSCTAQGLARIWVEFTGRFLGCPMCLPYLWDISLTFQPFWHLWLQHLTP